MSENKVQFAPFHAVNQFMLPEYRQQVIQKVLSSLDQLSPERRGHINSMINRYVKIPGFRNSAQAPLALKLRNSINVFESHADFTAEILAGWSDLQPELRKQVYEVLKSRGWELLPEDTDRTKLPGFLVRWLKSETYEEIDATYQLQNPDIGFNSDDVRLMAVWLGGRLPYDMVEVEKDEE